MSEASVTKPAPCENRTPCIRSAVRSPDRIDNETMAIYGGVLIRRGARAAPPRCSTRSTPPPRGLMARCTKSRSPQHHRAGSGEHRCNFMRHSIGGTRPARGVCNRWVYLARRRHVVRTCRCQSTESAARHHARDCAARLGPVKAFRADYRCAPTPDGADRTCGPLMQKTIRPVRASDGDVGGVCGTGFGTGSARQPIDRLRPATRRCSLPPARRGRSRRPRRRRQARPVQ